MKKQKPFRQLIKKHSIDVYNHDIVVVVTTDIRESWRRIKDKIGSKHEPSPSTIAFVTRDTRIAHMFICNDTGCSTIAHESFHLAYRILDHVGVELCEHSEEAYAYLLGDITYRVATQLGAFMKLGKKKVVKKPLTKRRK